MNRTPIVDLFHMIDALEEEGYHEEADFLKEAYRTIRKALLDDKVTVGYNTINRLD